MFEMAGEGRLTYMGTDRDDGAGDWRRTLALLMKRHGDDIYRYALAMTKDHALAEEVRQQVFLRAYRSLQREATPVSASNWLFGIARHCCLDAMKANQRWQQRYKNEEPEEPVQEDEVEPARELDLRRLAQRLATCLTRLAPAVRDAVILRFHQGLSYEEAAVISGDQAATLRQRVTRALPLLRKCLGANLQLGEW